MAEMHSTGDGAVLGGAIPAVLPSRANMAPSKQPKQHQRYELLGSVDDEAERALFAAEIQSLEASYDQLTSHSIRGEDAPSSAGDEQDTAALRKGQCCWYYDARGGKR